MKKLFIVVNVDWFFLSHRLPIALAAQKAGWDVTIVTRDTGRFGDILAFGLKTIDLPINATGLNLREEWKTYSFLHKLYKNKKPEIVHHVGLKTILWGGLAAKMTKVKGVVNAVSGLGVLFSDEKPSLMANSIMMVLRFSHRRRNVYVIFQNHEDERLFLKYHIIRKENCMFVKGSGVDLDDFTYVPETARSPLRVLFAARMVREKGVIVLLQAAEVLRKDYEGKVEFLLCGKLTDNPQAIQREELEALCDGKYIQWLGYRTDVKELLRLCNIVAFPSYYREGVPKSLIEACAVGRPIITCNSIGCKDTVDDGVNGFLIPIKDCETLAEKLKLLIENPELRKRMGVASRKKAEKEFSLENVIERHIEIYKSLE